MAAQVLRDKGAVTKMDYIICTGTVRQCNLCKFNHGLLANVTHIPQSIRPGPFDVDTEDSKVKRLSAFVRVQGVGGRLS